MKGRSMSAVIENEVMKSRTDSNCCRFLEKAPTDLGRTSRRRPSTFSSRAAEMRRLAFLPASSTK